MKILVVDDDPMIHKILEKTLYLSNFKDVTFAASAEEAAQIIAPARPPFDCMFLDMKMAGAGGDKLCRWVRRLPRYERTPIVMITALGEKADIDRAFAAGASDYVTKPLDLPNFVFQAEQIRLAKRKTRVQENNKPRPEKNASKSNQVYFSKPEFLGGIPGELELTAMERYLFRLSKSGFQNEVGFALVINDAAKLNFVCPHDLFVKILQVVGATIAKSLPATEVFLAYAGYGAFVGVAQGLDCDEEGRGSIERRVRSELEKIVVHSSNGGELHIVPVMSIPQQLCFSEGQKAVDTLYRHIGEAEARGGPSFSVGL